MVTTVNEMSKMCGYKVISSRNTVETSPADPDVSPYSHPSTFTEHCLHCLMQVDDRPDVLFNRQLEIHEGAFLVYIIYNEGDSFGEDTASKLLPIALYDSEKAANESAIRPILKHYNNNNPDCEFDEIFKITLKDDEGNDFTIPTPWIGYFNGIYKIDCVF